MISVGSLDIASASLGTTTLAGISVGATEVWAPAAPPSGFDPLSIPWHSAFYADTLALADGASVSSWTDASGNSHPAVSAAAVQWPTYRAATAVMNGKPSVQFNATDDVLFVSTFPSVPQPYTFVAVVHPLGLGGGSIVALSATSARRGISSDATGWLLSLGTISNTNVPNVAGVSTLLIGLGSGAASKFAADGGAEATVSAGTVAPTELIVGARGQGIGAFNGYIGFIGLLPRALTTQEKSDLLAWSRSHYGTP